jgi:hypothetical protein
MIECYDNSCPFHAMDEPFCGGDSRLCGRCVIPKNFDIRKTTPADFHRERFKRDKHVYNHVVSIQLGGEKVRTRPTEVMITKTEMEGGIPIPVKHPRVIYNMVDLAEYSIELAKEFARTRGLGYDVFYVFMHLTTILCKMHPSLLEEVNNSKIPVYLTVRKDMSTHVKIPFSCTLKGIESTLALYKESGVTEI